MKEGESSVGMILIWKTAAGGVLGGLGWFPVLGCLGVNTSPIAVGIGTNFSSFIGRSIAKLAGKDRVEGEAEGKKLMVERQHVDVAMLSDFVMKGSLL
jgi:hypothetical protein